MGTTTLRRRDYMRAVVQVSRGTGDTVTPWSGLGDLAPVFDDESDLLVEMHREWLRLVLARLHRGEIVPRRSPADVRDLYEDVVATHPTLRAILDAHSVNPALWDPTAREHAMLARIAGLAPDGTDPELAAAAGRALVTQRLPFQRAG